MRKVLSEMKKQRQKPVLNLKKESITNNDYIDVTGTMCVSRQ